MLRSASCRRRGEQVPPAGMHRQWSICNVLIFKSSALEGVGTLICLHPWLPPIPSCSIAERMQGARTPSTGVRRITTAALNVGKQPGQRRGATHVIMGPGTL